MTSNDQMVDRMKAQNIIKSPEIEEAFRKVDRAKFVKEQPYIDRPYFIKRDSTVSAPHIVAEMLELLEPEGHVLEMGSGSGYVLALLTHLSDKVTGVEIDRDLVHSAREKVPEAEIICGENPPNESFDRVLYSFATESLDSAIESTEIIVAPMLKNGDQFLYRFKNGERKKYGRVRFVKDRKRN